MQKKIKMLYASSPDRGLEHLLKMWPRIREKLPNAELHNCYGFQLFLKGYSNNPYMMKWYDEMQELLKQEGIFDYGRVSKDKLDEITASCDLWVYPTHFQETFCITAVRSQSLGCVPVTVNLAALEDTVFSGVKLDVDNYDPEAKELFFQELIKLATDEERLKAEKEKGILGAKKYAWENIAKQWMTYIQN